MKQQALPFPIPEDAQMWPNGLGFDWRDFEFWTEAGGIRDHECTIWARGSNWVEALSNVLNSPKKCD